MVLIGIDPYPYIHTYINIYTGSQPYILQFCNTVFNHFLIGMHRWWDIHFHQLPILFHKNSPNGVLSLRVTSFNAIDWWLVNHRGCELVISMAISGSDKNWRYLPYIYGLFLRPKFQGISPQNMAWKMVLTYLHFRILEISHWSYAMLFLYPQPSQKSPLRDHDHDMVGSGLYHTCIPNMKYLFEYLQYNYRLWLYIHTIHPPIKKHMWNIITDYAILYIYTNENPLTESNSIMPPHDDCLALPSVKPLVHWCASALPFQHGEHCRTPWFVTWAYSHHVRHPALGGTSDII